MLCSLTYKDKASSGSLTFYVCTLLLERHQVPYRFEAYCSVLQRVAVCCSVLQFMPYRVTLLRDRPLAPLSDILKCVNRIFMYVCMCTCEHVCTYIHIYAYSYVCMYTHKYICSCIYTYIYIYTCVYVCIYVYIHINVYITYAYMYVYI